MQLSRFLHATFKFLQVVQASFLSFGLNTVEAGQGRLFFAFSVLVLFFVLFCVGLVLYCFVYVSFIFLLVVCLFVFSGPNA